jgi:hypothetical protein
MAPGPLKLLLVRNALRQKQDNKNLILRLQKLHYAWPEKGIGAPGYLKAPVILFQHPNALSITPTANSTLTLYKKNVNTFIVNISILR